MHTPVTWVTCLAVRSWDALHRSLWGWAVKRAWLSSPFRVWPAQTASSNSTAVAWTALNWPKRRGRSCWTRLSRPSKPTLRSVEQTPIAVSVPPVEFSIQGSGSLKENLWVWEKAVFAVPRWLLPSNIWPFIRSIAPATNNGNKDVGANHWAEEFFSVTLLSGANCQIYWKKRNYRSFCQHVQEYMT